MFKDIRIKIIRFLIELNEKIFFNRKLLKIYKSLIQDKPLYILDIGANTGQSIDIFLELNQKASIIAFEPNPTLFDFLKQKYSKIDNVDIIAKGVSNSIGKKIFYENVFHNTSSFEDLDYNSEYLKKKASILGVKPENIIKRSYEVEVTTLADFINTTCQQNIDILKIDTEGHEYACLIGLFEKSLKFSVKYIQIEVHNDDMYANNINFNEITILLNKHGFEMLKRVKHGFGDFEDVIFINKSVNS